LQNAILQTVDLQRDKAAGGPCLNFVRISGVSNS